MPRTKPTTVIDIIGKLERKPEEVAGEYLESKLQKKYYVKEPNWDSAGDSNELLYICNNREHETMLSFQKEMLETKGKDKIHNEMRIRRISKVHANLRKRFIEVNHFMKERLDKRSLAEKKIAEQVAVNEKIQEGIDKFKHEITTMSRFRNVLKNTLRQYEPYEKVLNDVINYNKFYASIDDCIGRCDALMRAQVEILNFERLKFEEIEEMRANMVQKTTDAAMAIMGLKNDLGELERNYHSVYLESVKWEKILSKTKNQICSNENNRDRALDGLFLICRLLHQRQHKEMNFYRSEVERELDYVRNEVEVLREVVRECTKAKKVSTKKVIPC